MFKQFFVLILSINLTYTILSLEHLDFPSFLALLWVLRFEVSFVLVFEYITLLPNIITSGIPIITCKIYFNIYNIQLHAHYISRVHGPQDGD